MWTRTRSAETPKRALRSPPSGVSRALQGLLPGNTPNAPREESRPFNGFVFEGNGHCGILFMAATCSTSTSPSPSISDLKPDGRRKLNAGVSKREAGGEDGPSIGARAGEDGSSLGAGAAEMPL
mmetsp:Transcript_6846/g.17944  ORF Transcript_6846/g.17944 Transcript_6846/m.17944 type:complete len:124 (+) Transcript_6846:831-1202(+)